MSIKGKVIIGSIWNAISQAGTQGINIVIMIVLAALLGPENFGLIGMVTVFTGFLGFFTEFGLTTAVIKKKDADLLDYNTLYWSQIFFSILTYTIVFFIAPLIAKFYNEPELTFITRVVFIDYLFKPFISVHWTLEIKSLNYEKIAKSQLLGEFSCGIIAIILALLGFGVWSLAWQAVSKSLFFTIGMLTQLKWRPQFIFSFARFKIHFLFGTSILVNNLVKYASECSDYLLIGKLLNPTALGVYTFAFKLSRYPVEKLWGVVGTTLFPAFATIQDDNERLRKNILRISIAGGLIIIPILALLFFGTEPIIKILGKKWWDSIPVMSSTIRIFIIYIFILSISFGDEPYMIAKNNVNFLNLNKFLSSIGLLIIGYFAIKNFDIIGMACTYTIISIIYAVIIKQKVLNSLGLNFRMFINSMKFLIKYSIIIFVMVGIYHVFSHNRLNDILYITGAVLIISAVMIITNIKYNIIDIKKRDINVDAILAE